MVMQTDVFPDWSAPPRGLLAESGQVDVWRIELAQDAAGPRGDPRLSTRRALRQILAAYLDRAPDQLCFAREAGGKPYLLNPAQGIEFNLSHCRGLALVAVASSYRVGVDVETARELKDPLRLARRVMSGADLAELEALPRQERPERFLRLWTRMEARQKALGLGVFSAPADTSRLSSFDFRVDDDAYASLSLSPPAVSPRLRFLDFAPF